MPTQQADLRIRNPQNDVGIEDNLQARFPGHQTVESGDARRPHFHFTGRDNLGITTGHQLDFAQRLCFAGGIEVQGKGLARPDGHRHVEQGQTIEPPPVQFNGRHHAFRCDAESTLSPHAEQFNVITAGKPRQDRGQFGVHQQLRRAVDHRKTEQSFKVEDTVGQTGSEGDARIVAGLQCHVTDGLRLTGGVDAQRVSRIRFEREPHGFEVHQIGHHIKRGDQTVDTQTQAP